MSAPVVAFAGRGDAPSRWIDPLERAMPEVRLVPVDALDDAERSRVRVAIVADPDPAALAALPHLVWVQGLWAGVEGLVSGLGGTGVTIVRPTDPRLADAMAEAVLTEALDGV